MHVLTCFCCRCSSLHESRALHALLVSSQASDGSAASTHEQDAVPQLTLPLQDAPHHSSQQQHRRPLSAQAYYGSSGGDLGPAADQSPGGSIQVRQLQQSMPCAAGWHALLMCGKLCRKRMIFC